MRPLLRAFRDRYFLALLLFSCILFLWGLGRGSFWDRDESTYAVIAREMVERGDWITPTYNHEPWFCHPPLYMWLSALTASVFGWTEWSFRFWSAFFGIGMILITYGFGRVLFSPRTGFWAGLICATSLQVFLQARLATMDTIFNFFMFACLFFLWLGFRSQDSRVSRKLYLASFVAAGSAVMAKGPFGALYPWAVFCLFLICAGRLAELRRVPWAKGSAVMLLIGAPWYVMETLRHGRPFLDEVFLFYHFKRLVSPIMNQAGPWYYYLPIILLGFFPWISFLPFALAKWRSYYRSPSGILIMVWILFTFLFFTLVRTKLPNYVLSLYPALSLLTAKLLEDYLTEREAVTEFVRIRLSLVTTLLMTFFLIGAVSAYSVGYFSSGKSRAAILAFLPYGFLLPLGALGAMISFHWTSHLPRGLLRSSPLILLACTAASFYLHVSNGLGAVLEEHYKPVKPLSKKLAEFIRAEDRLISAGFSGTPSLIFYSGHHLDAEGAGPDFFRALRSPGRTFALATAQDFERLRARTGMSFTILGSRGSLVLFVHEKK
ncbi:MAG: glycosyltransferase family 39 protein [Armatimonadetes bacterium]|nr:glycosyltransferase family 39 protein [Armatimonadota bacterium]